jgi:hypothetical protein
LIERDGKEGFGSTSEIPVFQAGLRICTRQVLKGYIGIKKSWLFMACFPKNLTDEALEHFLRMKIFLAFPKTFTTNTSCKELGPNGRSFQISFAAASSSPAGHLLPPTFIVFVA